MTKFLNEKDAQGSRRKPGTLAPSFPPSSGETSHSQTTAISKIVKATRADQKLSLRDFAAALSDSLGGISHQTVKDWEDGTSAPQARTVLPLMLQFDDWRRDLAFDILSVLNPGLYKPATKIGREAQP